jgi:DMSO/TMAO reductase YedYZ molybdopterin-dependent catalytic subunit
MLLSLLLAAVLLIVLTLGILWNERFGPEEYWLRQTAVSWHWMLALGLLVPFAIHVWQRWPKPKRIDFVSRRAALRLLTAGSLGAAGYFLAQALSNRRDLPQALRRFTGSRATENFTGNLFPVTQSFPVHPDQINPQTWRLRVIQNGRSSLELTYADLLALPTHEINATLDCTLGWYSTQTWRGVRLVDLLNLSGASPEPVSVRIQSVTGYSHILPYREAKEILLATHVGGEALALEHGFPIRAVVPSRRGWFWVKWLAQIEPVDFLPAGES